MLFYFSTQTLRKRIRFAMPKRPLNKMFKELSNLHDNETEITEIETVFSGSEPQTWSGSEHHNLSTVLGVEQQNPSISLDNNLGTVLDTDHHGTGAGVSQNSSAVVDHNNTVSVVGHSISTVLDSQHQNPGTVMEHSLSTVLDLDVSTVFDMERAAESLVEIMRLLPGNDESGEEDCKVSSEDETSTEEEMYAGEDGRESDCVQTDSSSD